MACSKVGVLPMKNGHLTIVEQLVSLSILCIFILSVINKYHLNISFFGLDSGKIVYGSTGLIMLNAIYFIYTKKIDY